MEISGIEVEKGFLYALLDSEAPIKAEVYLRIVLSLEHERRLLALVERLQE